ncbi:MAG: helix-turn-helix domain-containing protein [Lachnospiraceae bacterium]|nr:helix-turn-helix domain-containing protein [Lachnospiraceae bacterium]
MKSTLNCERLKEQRLKLGLSKIEASKLTHLTQSGYVRYESGERNPAYPMIMVMAAAFKTTPEYLTGSIDDPTPDYIVIDRKKSPEAFYIAEHIGDMSLDQRLRLMAYFDELGK